MKSNTLSLLLLLLTAVLSAQVPVNGQLDSSFAVNGVMSHDVTGVGNTNYVNAGKIGPDGKFYVAGAIGTNQLVMFVARYNLDGTIDTSFGGYGFALIDPFISNSSYGRAMDIQPDGKIVIAGTATAGDAQQLVVRLNTDGSLDTSFNHTGYLTTGYPGNNDAWYAVTVQYDGKIMLGGYASPTAADWDLALMRLNADGTPDATFGVNGVVEKELNGSDLALEIVQHAPNRYYVIASIDQRPWLLALNGTGADVLTFGTNGKREIDPLTGDSKIFRMQTTPDGKIWLAGWYNQNSAFNSLFCRLASDGSYDTTFSGDGVFMEDMSPGYTEYFTDFEIQDDGQVLLTGLYYKNTTVNFWTMIINTLGYVNTSYGIGGVHVYEIGESVSGGFLARDADEKVWISGFTTGSNFEAALLKLKTTFSVGIDEGKPVTSADDWILYPNPVTTSATLSLDLDVPNTVSIVLTDMSGSTVSVLVDRQQLNAGIHAFDVDGSSLSSGAYLVHITAGDLHFTKKLLKVN